MTNNVTHAPPGPKGLPILGLAFEVRSDPLGTLQRLARQYGDIVSMPVMRMSRVLVNRPDYIQQLLILDHAKLHKSTLTKLVVGPLLGQGLLISEGDFWRRQRRLAQPAFHRSRTNEYSPVMVECALERMRQWRGGETRNIAEEMMKLTLEVAVRSLFGTTLAGEGGAEERAHRDFERELHHFFGDVACFPAAPLPHSLQRAFHHHRRIFVGARAMKGGLREAALAAPEVTFAD